MICLLLLYHVNLDICVEKLNNRVLIVDADTFVVIFLIFHILLIFSSVFMTISFVKFSFLCYFFSSSILFLNLNFQHTNLHLFKNINSFRLLLFHFFYIIVIVYAARCLFCMDLIDFWCGCTLHGMHSFQFIVVDVLKGKLLVPTIKLKNTT